ncbi:hypothetical protein EDC01DRAFT_624891, partial [Geopyxis carbonaria]
SPSNTISFSDPVLFPSPQRTQSSLKPLSQPTHSGARISTVPQPPQPRRVSQIVHSLGYATSPASFSYRSPSSYSHSRTHSVNSQHCQPEATIHPSPILHPSVAAKYFSGKQTDGTPPRSIMTADNMKIVDPESWDEQLYPDGDFPLTTDFSPHLSNNQNSPGATVSPSDIHVNPSVTGSAAFTSPYSLFDSPSEGYETSPLFNTNDDLDDSNGWYSLFPPTTTSSEDSPLPHDHVISHSRKTEPGSPSSTESPDTSPRYHSSSGAHKRSSTSGVRKRTNPLPPIVVEDPSDVIAVKRARNTLAARKSRAKKAEKMEDLEDTIAKLRKDVEYWKNLYHTRVGPP